MMYKKILVPLDGSEESEKALGTAKTLLEGRADTHLLLLRVLEIPASASWTSSDVIEAHAEEKVMVEKYLAEIKAGLELPSVDVIVHPGPSAARAIAEVAQRNGVDLIAMTCHGRSALHQFILGSQTEQTLRLAKCSVLVVRDPENPPVSKV